MRHHSYLQEFTVYEHGQASLHTQHNGPIYHLSCFGVLYTLKSLKWYMWQCKSHHWANSACMEIRQHAFLKFIWSYFLNWQDPHHPRPWASNSGWIHLSSPSPFIWLSLSKSHIYQSLYPQASGLLHRRGVPFSLTSQYYTFNFNWNREMPHDSFWKEANGSFEEKKREKLDV